MVWLEAAVPLGLSFNEFQNLLKEVNYLALVSKSMIFSDSIIFSKRYKYILRNIYKKRTIVYGKQFDKNRGSGLHHLQLTNALFGKVTNQILFLDWTYFHLPVSKIPVMITNIIINTIQQQS